MKRGPNLIDTHVGKRVRMRRLIQSMTQEKLADALGLTFQQVQKYEKGTNRIGAGRLQKIADILEVSVGFFFDGAPSSRGNSFGTDESVPDYVTRFFATSEGPELTKAFMRIKQPALRRSIVRLVKDLTGEGD